MTEDETTRIARRFASHWDGKPIGDDWGQPYTKLPLRWWIEDIAKGVCLIAVFLVFAALLVGLAHYD